MTKYKAPQGVTGINIGGQQFNVDADGNISLPDEGSYSLPPGYERVDEMVTTVKPVVKSDTKI